jgi:hypothetical protein
MEVEVLVPTVCMRVVPSRLAVLSSMSSNYREPCRCQSSSTDESFVSLPLPRCAVFVRGDTNLHAKYIVPSSSSNHHPAKGFA